MMNTSRPLMMTSAIEELLGMAFAAGQSFISRFGAH
jgi:hypothetical protein